MNNVNKQWEVIRAVYRSKKLLQALNDLETFLVQIHRLHCAGRLSNFSEHNAKAIALKGRIMEKLGRTREALNFYNRALEQRPYFPWVFKMRRFLLLGSQKEAEKRQLEADKLAGKCCFSCKERFNWQTKVSF
jgi:hypothetical protein